VETLSPYSRPTILDRDGTRNGFFFHFGAHFTLHGRKSCIPGFIAGFQTGSWIGGVVFSKIVCVALISLLGPASVFCHDASRDVSQADTTERKPKALQVGANVEAAQLIRQVAPVYPPIAKTAHISGTVVLHAIIGKDGTVEDLQFVSGPPLLLKSAMDAVK
jgi:hypothetical protein